MPCRQLPAPQLWLQQRLSAPSIAWQGHLNQRCLEKGTLQMVSKEEQGQEILGLRHPSASRHHPLASRHRMQQQRRQC